MKTFDVEQYSPEWFALRRGVVTASEIDALVTPAFKARTGEGVETYLCRKLAEKVTGYAPEAGSTFQMDQGSLAEKLALPWFNFTHNRDARAVGFCLSDDGRIGCSPDALDGDDSGLEIKFPAHPTHLKYLMRNELPPEYRAQVHFSMMVTGRPRWTFLSFSRAFPSLVIEVKRDEAIQDALRDALGAFLFRFDEKLAWLTKQKQDQDAPLREAYEAKIAAWEKTGIVP